MKRGRLEVLTIVIVLLLVVVGFSLLDIFNRNMSKKEISASVVGEYSGSDKELQIKKLTDQLNDLNSNFKIASSQTKGSIRNSLIESSRQRKQLMLGLIEENPELVLKNALKQDVIDSMPDEVRENLEKRVIKEGDLEVISYDDFENKKSWEKYYLNENGKKSSLHFADSEPFGLISGTKVRLSGLQIDNKIALYKNPADEWHTLEVLSVPDLKEFNQGEQKTVVILVDFLDDGDPVNTADEIREAIFNDPNGLNGFIREASYGKTWLTGEIFGWYTIPEISECNAAFIERMAIEYSDPEIYFPSYSRIIFITPFNPKCTVAVGTIGLADIDSADGASKSSKLRVTWSGNDVVYVMSHELGHNFGAYHAISYDCGSNIISVAAEGCKDFIVGDPFDVMGRGIISKHQNAYIKKTIGWLDQSNEFVVLAGGRYVLYPLEIGSSNIKSLKIPLRHDIPICLISSEGDCLEGYWVDSYILEYRIPFGFDSGIGEIDHQGIILRATMKYQGSGIAEIAYPGIRGMTALLDTTPNSIFDSPESWIVNNDAKDSLLILGNKFYDPLNEVSIEPIKLTEDGGIEVAVVFPDTKYSYFKNSQGQDVARFGNGGNIVLKGKCFQSSNCVAPSGATVFKNNADTTAYIDNNGNLCIESGSCFPSASCSPQHNSFSMKNEQGQIVSYIDSITGELCYTGEMNENGNL